MSAKKTIQFDEKQYDWVATLRSPSKQLRATDSGTIVEDPPLLESFGKLIDVMSRVVPPTLCLGEICVTEGTYVCNIHGVGDMAGARETIIELLNQFKNSAVKLETNAKRNQPSTADACGVGDPVLAVLEAMSALKEATHSAEVTLLDGETLAVSAPSKNALMALPTRDTRSDKKVDGEITGVGYSTKHECWIQVGHRSTFLAPMLTLDAALELLRQKMTVTSKAVWDGQDYILVEPIYAPNLNFGSSSDARS